MVLGQGRDGLSLLEPVCNRCGRAMELVADIAPHGDGPGLRVFVCDGCGAADSILVYRRATATPVKEPGLHRH